MERYQTTLMSITTFKFTHGHIYDSFNLYNRIGHKSVTDFNEGGEKAKSVTCLTWFSDSD